MTLTIFLGSLLLAMAIGIPISFALLVSGVALMWHMDMFEAQILAQNLLGGADNYPLLAVPFFLLAGEIMNEGGLSKRIVEFAMALVGHIRGGLGYVTIVASIMLSALSGSAVADAAALTTMLLPMMVAAGHAPHRAAGLIAASGVIAPVLPPSIGLVIFGVTANVSISKLFMAGIAPGPADGRWRCGSPGPSSPATKASCRRRASRWANCSPRCARCGWALMLPVIILVGLRMGVFTPTEAGVVAAVYALFVATVIYRGLKLSQLYGIFKAAAKTTAVVMFLVAAAMVSAWLITVADLPGKVVGMLQPFLGQPDPADGGDHGAGDDRRHGDGHDADHPDPHAGADAGRQGGRHRPGLLRGDVHHEQRHRPGHAAGGRGAERGGRGRANVDGHGDQGRDAVHDRAVHHHVPDGLLPLARHRAGEAVPRRPLTARAAQPRRHRCFFTT